MLFLTHRHRLLLGDILYLVEPHRTERECQFTEDFLGKAYHQNHLAGNGAAEAKIGRRRCVLTEVAVVPLGALSALTIAQGAAPARPKSILLGNWVKSGRRNHRYRHSLMVAIRRAGAGTVPAAPIEESAAMAQIQRAWQYR